MFAAKFDILTKPLNLDMDKFLTLSIYSENFFLNPNLINLTNFSYFNNVVNSDLAEDSYESFKALSHLTGLNTMSLGMQKNNFNPVISYASNLNMFRADFEESN
jgi:hypothetical protein